jgi:PIN domain nuclease of toxin-antitoxin system
MSVVLDSSALLALLWSEPGEEMVEAVLADSRISAVNMAEVYSKMSDRGVVGDEVRELLADLPVVVVAFDAQQAALTGDLRDATRSQGLSLGDRACLALAMTEDMDAVTGDRTWAALSLPIKIVAIR